jgi:N-acetylmuramoyl-L-alanine amidase
VAALLLLPGNAAAWSPAETVVVIDPGHGGANAGVSVPGETEKELSLRLATLVKERVEAGLGVKVLLTRAGDFEMSPLERAAMAGQDKASLFVSIHAGGSSSTSIDTLAAFFPGRRPGGVVAGVPGNSAWRVWNRQYEAHQARSRELAGRLSRALAEWAGSEPFAPVEADLFLLRGIDAPAAMVEVGCLTNRGRLGVLRDAAETARLAEILAGTVIAYIREFL